MTDQKLFEGENRTDIGDNENIAFRSPNNLGSRIISGLNFKIWLRGFFVWLGNVSQNIDGIKTFLKSPIVPDPTTDLQAVNLRTVLNAAQATSTKENVSTSIYYGGELTINGDNTKFDIAAGEVVIVDSYTDPKNPVFTKLIWTAQAGQTVDDIATQLITFVSVENDGAGNAIFTQAATTQSNTENRDKVELGVLVHTDLTTISKASSFPNANNDVDLKIADLAGALGRINIRGNKFKFNGTNLQIDKTEGEMWGNNVNSGNDRKSPNNIISAVEIGLSFLTVYGDVGTVIGGSNVIDTNNYNPFGVGGLIPIPDDMWTTHGIFFSPETGLTIMHYGQFLYDSALDALNSWRKESYNIVPELEGVAVRGVIAFKKGATDLSDQDQAKFIDPGAFGIITNENIPTFSRYAESVELLDGMSNFPCDITLIESGGTIYAEVQKEGGGDINFVFNQREYPLNCTTGPGTGGKARVALSTASSTATATTTNWVCAIRSGETAILQASTIRPTGEFSYIHLSELPNVATFLTDKAFLEQRYNDSKSWGGRSSVQRTNERIRTMPAEYDTGMTQTVTIDSGPSPDSVDYTQTTGSAWQKHLQENIPALQVSIDGIRIANHPITPGLHVTDLNSIELLQDSSGVSLSGKAFNWVVWISVGYKGNSHLWVNLPTKADDSNASAVSKQNNSDNTIPKKYKPVGALTASLPIKHSAAGGGTYTNLAATLLGVQVIDLRGQPAGSTTGGNASGIVNEFLDSLFRIISNATAFTAQFLATNLTANRVYTFQDKDGTIAHLPTATTIVSSATPTPTGDNKENELFITALAINTILAAPTGTPINGNTLLVRVYGASGYTFGLNAIYNDVGGDFPTSTTAGKELYFGAIYNSRSSKWDIVSWKEQI